MSARPKARERGMHEKTAEKKSKKEKPEKGSGAPAEATVPAAIQTPTDRAPVPQPDAGGSHDLSRSEYFLNRELTWLNFNYRVLQQADEPEVPLLERAKFIAIVSSNMDEFFMKRIGGLKQQVRAGVQELTVDGRTPQRQIDECYEAVAELVRRKRAAFEKVTAALRESGVALATYGELSDRDREFLRQYYLDNIFPLVTPQATDPAHPFPFISNLSLNLLVTLHHPGEPAAFLARVKVPIGTGIPRFLRLPDRNVFVPLEEVMSAHVDLLFPGMEIETCETFRVTRDANTELEEDKADDLLAMIETEVRERMFASVVRLEVAKGMTAHHRGFLTAELGLDENVDVFEVDGMLGLCDLWELASLEIPELRDPPHHPIDHPGLTTDRNIFHVIRDEGSILLHHPYESFPTSVERFLKEASQDPKVRAIKMTIYRTSEESKAIDYLIDAARNGKQVAVVVELKARFDEKANIRWANRLEEAGIHVTYGVVGLKTHCKVILVVRQDYNGLKRYAHLGTGNYHAGTARIYSDLGLFTNDPDIGRDCTELFNYLTTGYKPKRTYTKLLVAPKQLKRSLMDKIEREIRVHMNGSPGRIQFKLNALEDPDITRALYRAAQSGVKVDLVVRDTCRLRPGVPGLSEGVRVVSIVGRFLEHSRVYYFRNGGEEEYFIGSADAMRRNLNSRVETLVPVERDELRQELRFLLDAQLTAPKGAWEMRADGSYVQVVPQEGQPGRSSQAVLVEWAEGRFREATRLRRRKPRTLVRRNVR